MEREELFEGTHVTQDEQVEAQKAIQRGIERYRERVPTPEENEGTKRAK